MRTLPSSCDGQMTVLRSSFSPSSLWKELEDRTQSGKLGSKRLYPLSLFPPRCDISVIVFHLHTPGRFSPMTENLHAAVLLLHS